MAAKAAKSDQANPPEDFLSDASADLASLEALLGHAFTRRGLLELALTHRSVAHERAQQSPTESAQPNSAATCDHIPSTYDDNEQLEFLGDAVIGLIVAEDLYRRFPSVNEGGLTRMRAYLVSRRHLAEVALHLQLGRYLRLGRGEEQTGGRNKSALLANAIEAIFAAVYLDGGLDPVRRIITEHVILPSLDQLIASDKTLHTIGDHKSALQQRMQSAGLGAPRYIVTAESGPDHRKHFTVEVRMESDARSAIVLGHASAGTKKEAQQEAARLAFIQLDSLAAKQENQQEKPS